MKVFECGARVCLLRFPFPSVLFSRGYPRLFFDYFQTQFFSNMVSRLLIGDNNLSRFWAAFSFARPGLKSSSLMTATDLDTFDHALSQVSEEREQVIVSILTSVLLEEANSSDLSVSATNVCGQVLERLVEVCPRNPKSQVRSLDC